MRHIQYIRRSLSGEVIEKRKIKIGDLVAKIAQPIAKTADKILGTNVQNCDGCKKRKEKLNRLLK